MTEPSIHQLLSESFSPTDKKDWLRIASQELSEKTFFDNLKWNIDKINFSPYYTKDDRQELQYLKNFQLPHQRSWENVPKITVANEAKANAQALHFLALGADGVLFDVTGHIGFDINRLLDGINWSYCSVSFLSTNTKRTLNKILSHARQKKYDLSALRGSLFSNPADFETKGFVEDVDILKNYRSLGIVIQPSSPVQEIAQSLEQITVIVDSLTDKGVKKELAFQAIGLSLPCDENFFVTIAKFKATRILWYQLSQAFEIGHYSSRDFHLHAISHPWTSESFQPHGNMIKNTVQAAAAVMGGCNALTLSVEDDQSELLNRVSLHVSNLLKEESHLDNVADPVAGAYAVDCMVHEFAHTAWGHFQNRMRSHEA